MTCAMVEVHWTWFKGPIPSAKEAAQKKGLKVNRNGLAPGWNIELPCGSVHYAASDKEMIDFVRDR